MTERRVGQGSEVGKVILLTPQVSGGGGIQRVTRCVIKALADEGRSPAVLPVWRPDSLLVAEGQLAPIGSAGLGATRVRLWHKVSYALMAIRAAFLFKGEGAVTIVSHVALAPVALMMGLPFAVWCYGIEVWGVPSLVTRLALRKARLVLAISHFTAERVERWVGRDALVVVVPPCLTPELSLARPAPRRSRSTVLTVSRLDAQNRYKGVDTLIQVWPLVLHRVPDAKLVVVGDGPDKVRLRHLAELLGIAHSVVFMGAVSNESLASLYEEASVFALPARFRLGKRPEGEGFGLVYLEAAAAGLPVVAGRGGGANEAVIDGETGMTVEPSQPREVSQAIIALLLARDKARRMGENGRRRAYQSFSYVQFRRRIAEMIRILEA